MPAISRTGRGHGPLLQKIAELQSEQIYDNHSNPYGPFHIPCHLTKTVKSMHYISSLSLVFIFDSSNSHM
jgi:hypothetical protein